MRRCRPPASVYRLPSLDELIAAELEIEPGSVTVLGKASREAVDGETDVRTFEVKRDKGGAGSCLSRLHRTVERDRDIRLSIDHQSVPSRLARTAGTIDGERVRSP